MTPSYKLELGREWLQSAYMIETVNGDPFVEHLQNFSQKKGSELLDLSAASKRYFLRCLLSFPNHCDVIELHQLNLPQLVNQSLSVTVGCNV